MTVVNPNDQFTSGYSLGGDPHQLGVAADDEGEQYSAALVIAAREDIQAVERLELLDMLGLTKVARKARGAQVDPPAA